MNQKHSLLRGAILAIGIGVPGALISSYFDAMDQGFWISVIVCVSILLFTDWPDLSRFTYEKRPTQ